MVWVPIMKPEAELAVIVLEPTMICPGAEIV